jgi:hypothetical protein
MSQDMYDIRELLREYSKNICRGSKDIKNYYIPEVHWGWENTAMPISKSELVILDWGVFLACNSMRVFLFEEAFIANCVLSIFGKIHSGQCSADEAYSELVKLLRGNLVP